jgi:trehalose 6-phosphate phosphatase
MPLPSPSPDWALFLDFDGTLVDIAPTPDAIVVPDGLPDLLAGLARRLDGAVAVVSGRRLGDIDVYLNHRLTALAGLHGLERRRSDGAFDRRDLPEGVLAQARRELTRFAAGHEGVLVEDKGGSIGLHYRQAPECADACEALTRRLADASDGLLVVQSGKMVSEVKANGHHKGDAVAAFMSEQPFAGRTPVYAGDDVTDENGFAKVNEMNGVSIKVTQAPANTAAVHTLADPAAMRAWLADVLAALPEPETGA